jgi:DNA-binding NarL/FixJ family response regulator
LEILEEIKHQKIVQKDELNRLAYEKSLEEHFAEVKTKKERNETIVEALEDGYTQIEIANFLNVSRSLVSKIVLESLE